MAAIDQYDTDIQTAADKYGVPAPILRNLLIQENGGKPLGTSSKGAQGIAQMMGPTAKMLGVNPNDPHQAIPGAARYLSQLHARFGNWDQTLAAYNAGPGNVHEAIQKGGQNWQQALPQPAQTLPYVHNITSGIAGYNPTAADAGLSYDPIAAAAAAQSAGQADAGGYDPVAAAASMQAAQAAPKGMTRAQIEAGAAKLTAQEYQSMDFPSRVFVNAGSAMTNTARGVGGLLADAGAAMHIPGAAEWRQHLLESQAESDRAMAPATWHDPATWVGNALPLAATAPLGVAGAGARGLSALGVARGALGAAALSGLQEGSGGPTQSIPSELAQRGENALLALPFGAAGSALGGLVGRGVNALQGSGSRGAQLAQEAAQTGIGRVNSLLQPATVPEGYAPTAAEATGNAQLIKLQRAVQAQGSDALANRLAANQGALNQAWQKLRGTPQQVADAQKQLEENAAKWYGAARDSLNNPTGAVDGQALANAYDTVLGKYANDKTVQSVLSKYAEPSRGLPGIRNNPAPSSPFAAVGGAPSTGYPTDPNQLVQMRNSINADLDKQFTTDEAGTVARRAAPALMQLRSAIDQQLANASPAYAQANQLYAQAKAPINRMRLLQNVSNAIDPTGEGDVKTTTLRRALATVTGAANDAGYSLADDVDPASAQQLQDLYLTAARRDAVMRGAETGATSPATYNALQQTGMQGVQPGGSGALPFAARAAGWATGNPMVGEGAARTLGGISNLLTNPGSPARLAQQDALREAMTNYLLNNPQEAAGLLSQLASGPAGNALLTGGQAVQRGAMGVAPPMAYQYNPLAPQPSQQAAQ